MGMAFRSHHLDAGTRCSRFRYLSGNREAHREDPDDSSAHVQSKVDIYLVCSSFRI